jgi:hypothetical protein
MTIRFTDNFNRADANPIGGNWTTVPGSGAFGTMQIVSNQLQGGTSGDNAAYVNSDTPPNDQYSKIAIQTLAGGDDSGPMARVDTTTGDCYMIDYDGTNAALFEFTGAAHNLIGTNIPWTLVAGDIFEIRCVGTTISLWINGVQKDSVTNSLHTAGRAGVFTHASGSVMDNFESGDFASGGIALEESGWYPTEPQTNPTVVSTW